MKHLLLIEDDERIAKELIESFEQERFLVTHLKTVAQTAVVDLSRFAIAVIDWNLPDGEGIEVVGKVRAAGLQLPVLMLTANSDSSFRKRAIEAGANDFLGKPFYFHELRARIEVLLDAPVAGSPVKASQVIISGEIKIHKNELRALYKNQELVLTKKEFDLLLFFVTHPGTVFTRNELLDAVWGEDVNLTPRTVDTHVLHLRRKLDAELFQTVWSSGYRYSEVAR